MKKFKKKVGSVRVNSNLVVVRSHNSKLNLIQRVLHSLN